MIRLCCQMDANFSAFDPKFFVLSVEQTQLKHITNMCVNVCLCTSCVCIVSVSCECQCLCVGMHLSCVYYVQGVHVLSFLLQL